MKRKPLTTQDTFRSNLRMLLQVTGWSNNELSRRAGLDEEGKPRVSGRYVGMLLAGEYTPTIDVTEAIGAAFGLNGWHMIRPGLQYDLAKSGKLDQLLDNFSRAPEHSQEYVQRTLERDAPADPEPDGDNKPTPASAGAKRVAKKR